MIANMPELTEIEIIALMLIADAPISGRELETMSGEEYPDYRLAKFGFIQSVEGRPYSYSKRFEYYTTEAGRNYLRSLGL